ncbi:MAG: hypothetical protein WBP47_09975, partial [Candidatus Promineifilaceae bacterium]
MFKKFIDALKPPQEPDVKEPEKETAVVHKPQTKPRPNEIERQRRELEQIQNTNINALWAQMSKVIREIELRELILDLGISPTDIPETGKNSVYLELVAYMQRRRRIPELL